MIEFHFFGHPADAFSVSVIVRAIDRDSGIKKITVKDRFGLELKSESFDCLLVAELRTDPIETFLFPISVEGMDCRDVVTPPMSFPLVSGPTSDKDGVPVPCSAVFCADNPICFEANANALRARNEVVERCEEAAAIKSKRDALAATAAAMFALFVGLLGAAASLAGTFFGGWLAWICLALAALALLAALYFAGRAAVEEGRLEEANKRLQDARHRFTEAADDTFRACCRDCTTGDLTQPACP